MGPEVWWHCHNYTCQLTLNGPGITHWWDCHCCCNPFLMALTYLWPNKSSNVIHCSTFDQLCKGREVAIGDIVTVGVIRSCNLSKALTYLWPLKSSDVIHCLLGVNVIATTVPTNTVWEEESETDIEKRRDPSKSREQRGGDRLALDPFG